MTDTITKDFWVSEQKLLPTLLLLSRLVDYDFDKSDLDAVEYGLIGTSNEKDIWWSYPLTGSTIIDLRFARDEDNTDILFIQLSFDKLLQGQVDLAIFVVQEFDLKHRYFTKQ